MEPYLPLSLIADSKLIKEVAVIDLDGNIYCYPCTMKNEQFYCLDNVLRYTYNLFGDKTSYVTIHDVFTNQIILGFRLPNNSSIFIVTDNFEAIEIIRRGLIELIHKLRIMYRLLNK